MPRIKFLSEQIVPMHNPDGSDMTFEAGKTYEVEDASAHRWERRGVAEIVADKASKKAGDKADD